MKTISVPRTKEAMKRLGTNSCIDGDLAEIEIKQIDYEQLWKSGVFDKLNMNLDINIDDYEDEIIPIEHLQEAIDIVKEFHKNNSVSVIPLLELMKFALKRKTGVFFFF